MHHMNVQRPLWWFVHRCVVLVVLVLGVYGGDSNGPDLSLEVRSAYASAFSCTGVGEIPQAECEALVSLYNSTQGDAWFDNSNWLQTNSPCTDWYMVICSEGHVVELYLPSNHLAGYLPAELSKLVYLEFLDVSSNQLTGEVPSELGTLDHLEELYLACNELGGDFVGLATRLESLALLSVSLTQFEHVVVSQYADATGVEAVDLQDGALAILGEDNPGLVVSPCLNTVFMPTVWVNHLDGTGRGTADNQFNMFLPVIP